MAIDLRTGRGLYRLSCAAPAQSDGAELILTLCLERADGVERVVWRCRIARALLGPDDVAAPAAIVDRLAPWIEREFEPTREAALKSIRAEGKLFDAVFDRTRRGPF